MSKAKTLATTVSTGNVLADGTVAYAEVSGTPTLATVATSGAYADITGTPTLATVATTGAYGDVTGTPTLATVATSGAYADVTGTPTLATVATSGSYTDLTDKPTITDTATNIAGGSAGTIPYQTAADTTAMLAAGTAGQLLQTNGAGAPTWVDAAAGGAWTLLSEANAGGASYITFTNLTGYKNYVLIISKMYASTAGGILCQFSTNNGASWLTSLGYSGQYCAISSSVNAYTLSSYANGAFISPGIYTPATTTGGLSGTLLLPNPASTTAKTLIFNGACYTQSFGYSAITASAAINTSATVNALRIFVTSATMTDGNFKMYGIS